MTQAEYDAYTESPAKALAEAFAVGSDANPTVTLEKARAHIATLLTAGLQTPGHHFRTIAVDGATAGHVWFHEQLAQDPPQLYLYDIAVLEERRGQGLGTLVMAALEAEAAVVGASRIMLSVFFSNPGAIRLYRRLGYVKSERGGAGMRMTKTL